MDDSLRRQPPTATIKVRNFSALRDVALSLDANLHDILREVQMDPDLFSDPERIVPFAQADRLLTECLRATGYEDFGLRSGTIGGAAVTGLVGLVSLNCPTVREGLRTIAEGLKTSNTGGAVTLDVRQGVASVGYTVVAPGVENADQIIDWGMARLANVMRELCGSSWCPERVFLTRAAPGDRSRFDAHFRAPIEFCAPTAKFTFGAAVLDQTVKTRDPSHRDILAPLLDRALAEAADDFVFAVRAIVRTQICNRRLTRERVADAMGLSVHALRRWLAKSGIRFGNLADELKLELAEALLRKKKPIGEIAMALGFADKSAFTRAFKKWVGAPPARWRSERADSPLPGDAPRARR
jgi:AraC-like DNA-binding protein